MTLPVDAARTLNRIVRRLDRLEAAVTQQATELVVQHRAASVILPALAVGANTVSVQWNAPLPSNQFVAIACLAGNSALVASLSDVRVAVMTDTQTVYGVDVLLTNTGSGPIGANRRLNIYAIHAG